MNVGDIAPVELSRRCLTHVLALRFHEVIDSRLSILGRYVAINRRSMQEACGLVQESQWIFLLRSVVA